MAGGSGGTASLTEALFITGDRVGSSIAEVVVNNSSNDIDFRVETDNKENALHLDASADSVNIDAKLIGTRAGSATTLAGGGAIPTTSLTANVDSSGNVTGIIFAEAGTAGQMLIVQNTGANKLSFDNAEGTSLLRGVGASNDTILANETHVFVSDGTRWNWIGGGTGIQGNGLAAG